MAIFGTGIPKIKFLPAGIVAFTVYTGDDTLILANHGLSTVKQVALTTTDTLPDPLQTFSTTNYYVIYTDSGTFQLATNIDRAYAGTAINITDAGTGTHSIDKAPLSVSLNNAKIIKDEAVPDILVHTSEISGHKSYVDKGQHWEFSVLIHLFKDAGTAVSGCVQDTDPNYDSFTKVGHGFVDDDPVTVSGTLPSELAANTLYYINYTSTSVFTLATEPDGTDIDLANQGTTITVTPADHLITYKRFYQSLGKLVYLWRHSDGLPFIKSGVTDATSLSDSDYAKFRLESMRPVYITGEHGTEDGLHLVFKSVDWVDLYWNAGAF